MSKKAVLTQEGFVITLHNGFVYLGQSGLIKSEQLIPQSTLIFFFLTVCRYIFFLQKVSYFIILLTVIISTMKLTGLEKNPGKPEYSIKPNEGGCNLQLDQFFSLTVELNNNSVN